MVALFGGQGSQTIGMGQDLCANFSLAKQMCERASDQLHTDVAKLLWSENPLLSQSTYTQSAIFLVSMMAYAIYQQEGGKLPQLALGHSLGEISANGASGALDLESGLKLVFERGRLMEEVCAKVGQEMGMLAVLGADIALLESFCLQAREAGHILYVANFNGSQVVLAGAKAYLQSLEPKSLGAKKLVLLPMNVVSHCPLLEPMVAPFKALLEQHLKDSYHFGVVSNATTQVYKDKAGALECLGVQLIEPVRYSDCVGVCENEDSIYVEFGTSVLKNLNKRLSSKPTYSITDTATLKEALAV
ncbi:Malonyl CoA-acyl carrier protein transacylase [Helicobacter heilmannii]|uniref:ACP S-malonyltransferase n=1 Tax=Helicobacter heilmannii TaxID=35817 RepID=UPI0006A0CECB|nr:ACP S-malonyltransferase [Helicobacter heilmannii]CRF47135.1 Malonyl CoA-acyl carrier protein transacylase [Helicobacter heilmannii]